MMESSISILEDLRQILQSGNFDQHQLEIVSSLFYAAERILRGAEAVQGIVGIANDFTMSRLDSSVVLADATTGPIAVTLPEPSDILNVTAGTSAAFFVKKIDSTGNIVTLTSPTGTIDGSASYVMSTAQQGVVLVPDGDDWQIIANTGGSGGGSESLSLLEGFSTGNRFDAAANAFPGVATGFLFAGMFETQFFNPSSGQTIFHNLDPGIDGWLLGVEPNHAIQVGVVDAGGAFVSVTSGNDGGEPRGPRFLAGKHYVVLGQVVQNGANVDVVLWVNATKVGTAAGIGGAYAPRTATPQIGAGPFGNVAEESGIVGVGYYEGTATDKQIVDWFHACFAAGDLVAGDDIPWTTYSVAQGSPGATWDPTTGSGPTFNRTGSLTTVTRNRIIIGG